MKRNHLIPILVSLGLFVAPTLSIAQTDSIAGQMPGGYDFSALSQMFAVPQGVPQLNMSTPNGMAAFMNPTLYAQMMNPAFYTQMMSPGFYTQFMNPQNWMSWFNPSAYSSWVDSATYLQAMNPMSYMQFMNPLTYLQWANLNNYMGYVNPSTYTQWLNPGAYQFGNTSTSTGQATDANWFDPAAWSKEVEKTE